MPWQVGWYLNYLSIKWDIAQSQSQANHKGNYYMYLYLLVLGRYLLNFMAYLLVFAPTGVGFFPVSISISGVISYLVKKIE